MIISNCKSDGNVFIVSISLRTRVFKNLAINLRQRSRLSSKNVQMMIMTGLFLNANIVK